MALIQTNRPKEFRDGKDDRRRSRRPSDGAGRNRAGRRYRIDLQAGHEMVGHGARTRTGPARISTGVSSHAFGRPGPVLIDLPFDVQMGEIEFDPKAYRPLPVYQPRADREQIEQTLALLIQAHRPLIVAGGGIINADGSPLLVQFAEITGVPVIPTLMGWGAIPDNHALMAGMVGLQTQHRYGN